MAVINDRKANYNLEKHRYIITPAYVEDELGISLAETLNKTGDINPDTLPQRFLDFASLIEYTYIYTFNPNIDATEYYISQERFRDAILEAQLQLVYALILNNKPLGVFYTEKPEELVNELTKQILLTHGLLNRCNLINLPHNYKAGRGVEY